MKHIIAGKISPEKKLIISLVNFLNDNTIGAGIDFTHVHYPEHYLAWLESGAKQEIDASSYANYTEEQREDVGHAVEALYNDIYKCFRIFCPVDINVYDEEGTLVASIIDNEVVSDELPCYVNGDEKAVYLIGDEEYRMEYTGNDTGTMDYIVDEFNSSSETVRSVYYYDIPLEKGLTYTDTVTGAILSNDENYSITDGNHVTAPALDTMAGDNTEYNINVENGIAFQANAAKGEAVPVVAVADEGYEFVEWESDVGTDIFDSVTDRETRFRMPDKNVNIKAVLGKKNNNVIIIWIIVSVLVILIMTAAAVILIIVKKNNKKKKDVSVIAAIQILDGCEKGRIIRLQESVEVNVGKDSKLSQIVIDKQFSAVSRVHCNIVYIEKFEKYFVTDSSSNGTYIEKDGIRLQKGKRIPVDRQTVLFLADRACRIKLI